MTRKSKRSRQTVANTHPSPTPHSPPPATQSNRSWSGGVLLPALASALFLWAAFPPLAWGPLAWLAPLGWLLICQRELPVGRRGYFSLWLAGCLFWLLVLHGIRLAFWPLIFGWLALALYLAVTIPLFVATTRVMIFRWKWPLVLAAPTVWLGLELIRSYFLTGYAANTLAHTQIHTPVVIQIADQVGGGGLSFVMMTLAAAVLPVVQDAWNAFYPSQSLSTLSPRRSMVGLAWGVSLLLATVAYGWWRLDQFDRTLATTEPLLRVLLVQENTPSIFDSYSPEKSQQAWDAYLEMTRRGAAEHGQVDMVVWPESTFTASEPWIEQYLEGDVPAELQRKQVDLERLKAAVKEMEFALRYKANLITLAVNDGVNEADASQGDADGRVSDHFSEASGPFLLMGCDVWVYRTEKIERFNSALFISPAGELLDRYAKMHLVMFGEYIPLGSLLQWLRDAVGLQGTDAGTEVKCFSIGPVRVAPSICFESMMPRVVNRQVRELVARGESPAVLVNITNDSWFRGSSMLDHHLACSMLCAVENRRPLLVAGNTGLSADIDGCGRLLAVSQRSRAETLLAEPRRDGRWGLVQNAGYPLSWLCALVTVVAMCWKWVRRAHG